ncbi:G2 M phase-specific E3 ubiquitin- ligase-like [Paramuricea clavata]|uniref:G2 M phase-specific E3 ubiquitin- ligase-like n=1 Tax=Paramuricea clavata TaxID=317549 RepID=A0A7D9J9Y5_PARCT|nr:G2 M phase-specific E3 ubiquitin- ligase-like [Paramuricea clavata]
MAYRRPTAPTARSDNLENLAGLNVASSSNQNSARRTPREELQALFHRGTSNFQQSLPQFQRRTSWGPSPSSRSRSGSQGKLKPYTNTNSSKGKNSNKKTTFAREVVLLRRPSDSMVRGGAKAELQRLGHVISSFEFDKLWSANEVQEKLEEAFKKPLESIDGVLDNQSKIKIMMGMGNELVEPQKYSEEVEVIEDNKPVYHDPELVSSQDEEELVSESSFQLSSSDIRRYAEATSTNTMKTNHQADDCSTSTVHLQQHGESDPLPSSSFESKVNSLKEMFPGVSIECITQALHENNGDVQKAVNTLLGNIDEDLDSSSGSEEILQRSIWDTPLAASKILSSSSDARISLQKFVQ